jgi:peptide/nickel transport system substrate-binding protein
MKHSFKGATRKIAAAAVVALLGSLAQVAPSSAAKTELTILISEKFGSWCPQESPGIDQMAAIGAVFETLTIPDSRGRMVPYLADSVRANDATNKVWTIKLRPNIFFHDGEELTAQTVYYNMLALVGALPTVGASLPAIAFQDVMPIASAADVPKHLTVVSKYELKVTLAKARTNFMFLLYNYNRTRMSSTKMLLSPTCGANGGLNVGTGPWVVKSKSDLEVVLEANPNYWRKDKAGKKLPYAKTATVKVVLDAAQRLNAVKRGQADIVTMQPSAGTQINAAKADRNLNVIQGPRDITTTIHFNTTRAPFNSKLAREAVAHAIDRAAYVKVQLKGNGGVADAWATKGNPLYVKQSSNYNLRLAKAKAAEYKAATGRDIEFVWPIADTTESAKIGQQMCNFMAKADIKCTLGQPLTPTANILRSFGLINQITFFSAGQGPYPDFLLLFLKNTNLEMSGFRFTNPSLAAEFEAAQSANSRAGLRAAAKKVNDEVYWTGVTDEGVQIVTTKKISGISATPLPRGGLRLTFNPSFDYSSVVKSK